LTLEEIKGQEINLNAINKAIKSNSLGHAVLITGPPGSGKRTLANYLVQVLNCEREKSTPCNLCSNCYKIYNGTFPDLIRVSSEGRWIKIDQLRESRKNFSYHNQEGKFRICVIEEAHRLTSEAAASLLKSLEEPQEEVKYFLTSSMSSWVSPTIVSRCVQFKMRRLNVSQIKEILNNRFPETPPEKIDLAAQISNGVPGRAIEFLTDESWKERLDVVERLLEIIISEDAGEAELFWEAKKWSEREDLPHLLELLLICFRDGLLSSFSGNQELLVNPGNLLCGNKNKLTPSFFEEAMSLIGEHQKIIITTNANLLLTLEMMFLSIKGRIKYVPRNWNQV